jgi:hypothetical protein
MKEVPCMRSRFEVRKAIRLPMEVIMADWDEPVELSTSDLSPRGCFVRSGVLVDDGEPVVVSLRLSGSDEEMLIFGEVARVAFHRRRQDVGPSGFGIRFTDTKPMQRVRIRERLRGVPPPLPAEYPVGLS